MAPMTHTLCPMAEDVILLCFQDLQIYLFLPVLDDCLLGELELLLPDRASQLLSGRSQEYPPLPRDYPELEVRRPIRDA